MEMKIVGITVAILVSITVLAGVLVPVINDAQTDLGDPVTLQNTSIGNGFEYKKWDGNAISFSYTGGTHDASEMGDNYKINGEASGLSFVNTVQRILFASDAVCLRVAGGAISATTIDLQRIGNTAGVQQVEFTFEIADGGDYTLTLSPSSVTPTVIEGTITWLIYAAPVGDLNLLQIQTPTSPFYTGVKDDLIVLGNVYVTGDNDTFYSYYNGDLTVKEEYEDISSVEITKTDADGYTDIFDTTVVVHVGDESFTPYYILAPKTVTGHESSGASYDLLGIIPMLVIVAMLLGVIALVIRSKLD